MARNAVRKGIKPDNDNDASCSGQKQRSDGNDAPPHAGPCQANVPVPDKMGIPSSEGMTTGMEGAGPSDKTAEAAEMRQKSADYR